MYKSRGICCTLPTWVLRSNEMKMMNITILICLIQFSNIQSETMRFNKIGTYQVENVEISSNMRYLSLDTSDFNRYNFTKVEINRTKQNKPYSRFLYIRNDGFTFMSSDMSNWRRVETSNISPLEYKDIVSSMMITSSFIEVDNIDNMEWKLFNSFGSEVMKGRVISGLINLETINQGCYFLIINNQVIKILKIDS